MNWMNLGLLIVVAVAAVHHFGWLSGLGILATVWLLMPYQAVGVANLGPGRLR